jgi:hypothetical protein
MRTNTALYWRRTGVADDGTPTFAAPVLIKCRWDFQQRVGESNESVESVHMASTVFPDRILAIGSFLLYGNQDTLDAMTENELRNPMLLKNAVQVKDQKVTPEWRTQNLNLNVGSMSDHFFVEVTV